MNVINFISIILIFVFNLKNLKCNHDAKRLYDDLLSNYNKLVRPVINTTDILKVSIKLKLSQLIDVTWNDHKLKWNPKEYGDIKMIHLPSDHIWRPDIVLYNNADGNYEVKLMTKANIHYTGMVTWKPPTIYKSFCSIDVEFFPYDVQTCVLKLGSWTYDGFQVDLRHMDELYGQNIITVGIDLSEFYMSVEWDILEVPATRNEKFYTCCDEPYLDITFNITMRRKTLFYTVNIIIPCMGISFLTVLTFYLPSDSGEKVTLSISILISLHVFFLLVVEIIPPTSIVVPLLGKYLIFAMILVSLSICVTVAVLNVHFRSPQMCKMPTWIRKVFLEVLPRFLLMKRPKTIFDNKIERTTGNFIGCQVHNDQNIKLYSLLESLTSNKKDAEIDTLLLNSPSFSHVNCPQDLHTTCICIQFIAEHTKMFEYSTKIKEDWKYVGMVLDRLFLWIFASAVSVGTAVIILQAPSLYDTRDPIDKQFSNYSD